MPQAHVLPEFVEAISVSANAQDKTISLIFLATDNQHYVITLSSAESARLVSILLERTPPPDIEPETFASPLSGARTAIDQDGRPLLGLFFPSALSVAAYLNHETISLLKQTLIDLETKLGSGKNEKH